MIGFPTVPAMDKKKSPGSLFTLKEAPNSDKVCVVFSKYLSLAETSAILTQAYSPFSSKYLGSSIGRGEAPLFTGLNLLIINDSQWLGISPIHSIPESLYESYFL